LGKVSILFALLGAKTTLVDYSQRQIKAAVFLQNFFGGQPITLNADIFKLSTEHLEKFHVSMSFGTAEHFFGYERQMVFNAHYNVLVTKGLAIIHVPNKFGVVYKFGSGVRKFLGRSICTIEEKAFTRKELIERMSNAGFQDIMVFGGETLSHDVKNFIFNYDRFFNKSRQSRITEKSKIKRILIQQLRQNSQRITVLNNYFSYPLVAIGKKAS
jgi:hypothetical protein